jgi:hypothetical protein
MLTAERPKLLRFVVVFFLLFALLAWPFAFVGRGYRSLICGVGNRLVLSSAHTPYVGRLVPNPRADLEWHVFAVVWNQTTNSLAADFDIDVHQTFHLPTAVFGALALAGKFTWGGKRTVVNLLVAIAALQLRGALQFVHLERSVVDAAHAGLSDVLLVLANRSLVTPLSMAFVLPLILWFCLFRTSLVQRTTAARLPRQRARSRG